MSYYSYQSYTGNGSTTNYTIPFPYLYTTHVKVYVQGIEKTRNVHYTFLNVSTIQFSNAPPNGEIITIKRESGRDARLVDFQDAAILKESELDLNSDQLFYLMQEAFDVLTMVENEAGEMFVTPEAILTSLTNSITTSHLADSISGAVSFASHTYSDESIYEWDEDGPVVYESSIFGDQSAALLVLEESVEALVTDVSGNSAMLALMADEYFVKLDANGNVAGFGLYNGDTSQFIVNVDEFAIIASDGTGEVYVPFIVDTESGIVGIDGNLLVTGSITGTKIAADAIEADHIATGEIIAAHFATNAVESDAVKAGAITGVKIADSTIEAGNIKANAITADAIKAGEITANKMDITTLSSIAANIGTITSGLLKSSDDSIQVDLTNKWIKVWDDQDTPVLRVHLGYIS
jgi:hypothetical protein